MQVTCKRELVRSHINKLKLFSFYLVRNNIGADELKELMKGNWSSLTSINLGYFLFILAVNKIGDDGCK
jgi:hypothetical protein